MPREGDGGQKKKRRYAAITGDAAFCKLSLGLPAFTKHELRFAHNPDVTCEGACGLTHYHQMSLVDASGTGIEVQGAVTLLSNSCAATVLLNDCPFGDAGIEEIATELAPRMYLQWDGVERPILGTRDIRTLGLANTGMGDAGAKALAEALRHPECTVETVDVGGNAIGDAGARALRAAEAAKFPGLNVVL